MAKTYKIAFLTVHCPFDLNNVDKMSGKQALSSEEKLCQTLDVVSLKINDNVQRFTKLHNEYKCTSTYYLKNYYNPSLSNCNDPIHTQFYSKFTAVGKSLVELSKLLSDGQFDLDKLKSLNDLATYDLADLGLFIRKHINTINNSFEAASYDYEAEKKLWGLDFLAWTRSFLFHILEKNHFDLRLHKVFEGCVDIQADLNVVGLLTHFSHHEETDVFLAP